MAAGEPAVSAAAAKAEASARAKGERAAAARQVAIAKAEAAKAAAKEAKELARLAEEAKHTAEDLERERSKRRDGGSAKTSKTPETTDLDAERAEEPASLTDDELARRLHSEMNASPRLGRIGRRGALATEEKANVDEDSGGEGEGRRKNGICRAVRVSVYERGVVDRRRPPPAASRVSGAETPLAAAALVRKALL